MWSQTLEELPGQLLISNDGSRVSIIDQYYGNHHNRLAPAVVILDEMGRGISHVTIGELANLSRVRATVSNSEWYDKVELTLDKNFLDVETIIMNITRLNVISLINLQQKLKNV